MRYISENVLFVNAFLDTQEQSKIKRDVSVRQKLPWVESGHGPITQSLIPSTSTELSYFRTYYLSLTERRYCLEFPYSNFSPWQAVLLTRS